jgi:hypothetical protein
VYVPDALTGAGARAVALLALREQAACGAPINAHDLRVMSVDDVALAGVMRRGR